MKPSLQKTFKENCISASYYSVLCSTACNIEIVMYNSNIFKTSIKNVNFIFKTKSTFSS